jgi:coenzyme F420 hydrogenase subunit beta
MKIGLMGCEFESPNKGCEALTYSIISILNNIKSINKNITIYNFSGTKLGKIQSEFKNINFVNVPPSLKDMSFNYLKKLHECDVILDATMGDSFSDIYSKKYYERLILDKRLAEMLCKNYILLPQTYGPFYDKKSSMIAKKVFKKAKKIYCRDNLSKELLENEFNITNSELVTDMAFLLPYYKERYSIDSKKVKLGINVSGLLYKGGFNSSNQFGLKIDYKDYINRVIEYFLNNKNYEVHLIPHVIDISENAHDDDYIICKKLKEKYQDCVLAPAFDNPIDAKSYISNMDIFIGSRMHSTIAAFSSGVVTIPVSYSRKFEGLFNSLNYNFVINGKLESTESAFDKTIEYVNKKEELKNMQLISEEIIEEQKKKFIEILEKYMVKEVKNNEYTKKYNQYCTGCGLCHSEYNCDKNIKNGFTEFDLNNVDNEFLQSVCPYSGESLNNYNSDPFGEYFNVYYGWSKDNAIRHMASSGGTISSLAIFLLEKNYVDGIIQIKKDDDIPINTKTVISYTKKEILECVGSRYCNSSVLENLSTIVDKDKKYAIIGRPCDIFTLKQYQNKYHKYENIIYTISFFCAGNPSNKANEKLLNDMGIKSCSDCTLINYRGNGWPGYAIAINKKNKTFKMRYAESWGNYLGRDIRLMCKFCVDGVGAFSDISCGDGWYLDKNSKPIFDENEGRNLIFSRNSKGDRLIQDAERCGYIHLEEFNSFNEKLENIQPAQYDRTTTVISKILAFKIFFRDIPKYNIKLLYKLSKRTTIKRKLHIFLGTIKRVIKKRM